MLSWGFAGESSLSASAWKVGTGSACTTPPVPMRRSWPNSSRQPTVANSATEADSAKLTLRLGLPPPDCTLLPCMNDEDMGALRLEEMMAGRRKDGSKRIPERLRRRNSPVSLRLTRALRPESERFITTAGTEYVLESFSRTSTCSPILGTLVW